MHIAYVTTYDAKDVHQWSGTGKHMAECLNVEGITTTYIGNLHERYSGLLKAKQFFCEKFAKKRYLRHRSAVIAGGYSKQVEERLSGIKPDVIFSPSSIPVAYLESQTPIVFWTDATFAAMLNFYPEFSNLCAQSIFDGNAAEQAALDRCALAIYSSDWAANSALEHYKVDEKKIKVISFGANLDSFHSIEEMKQQVEAKKGNVCKLLFIGVDWKRKGGDTVLNVAKELNNRGIMTELTVVGCAPDISGTLPSFVTLKGFISKSTNKGLGEIKKLLSEAHFLFVPSHAECSPIVFGEANAFGVPCISRNVGGVGSVIKNNVNGFAFDRHAPISEYCQYIGLHMQDFDRYRKLAYSSFTEYQERLNWGVAGNTVRKMMLEII